MADPVAAETRKGKKSEINRVMKKIQDLCQVTY